MIKAIQELNVEAYTASWIEIKWNLVTDDIRKSRLIQPRGLKCPFSLSDILSERSRLIQPRGLKYPHVTHLLQSIRVEAYTASWIEIYRLRHSFLAYIGRGLYSLVD